MHYNVLFYPAFNVYCVLTTRLWLVDSDCCKRLNDYSYLTSLHFCLIRSFEFVSLACVYYVIFHDPLSDIDPDVNILYNGNTVITNYVTIQPFLDTFKMCLHDLNNEVSFFGSTENSL